MIPVQVPSKGQVGDESPSQDAVPSSSKGRWKAAAQKVFKTLKDRRFDLDDESSSMVSLEVLQFPDNDHDNGHDDGYDSGHDNGHDSGHDNGHDNGQNNFGRADRMGRVNGFEDGDDDDNANHEKCDPSTRTAILGSPRISPSYSYIYTYS